MVLVSLVLTDKTTIICVGTSIKKYFIKLTEHFRK
jgi:hypothetical protein